MWVRKGTKTVNSPKMAEIRFRKGTKNDPKMVQK